MKLCNYNAEGGYSYHTLTVAKKSGGPTIKRCYDVPVNWQWPMLGGVGGIAWVFAALSKHGFSTSPCSCQLLARGTNSWKSNPNSLTCLAWVVFNIVGEEDRKTEVWIDILHLLSFMRKKRDFLLLKYYFDSFSEV